VHQFGGEVMRRHWILWTIVTAILAGATGGAYWLLRPTALVVTHPAYGPAVQAVYATGTVEPVIMMPIAPRIGARIVVLAVDEGAVVKAGQMLARLESDDVRNSIAQLEAQEDFARRDYQRDATLVGGGVIPRQTYDRAKSAWMAAKAAVAAARAQSSYMTLVAPNDGRIIRRDGEVGQFLPVNQPLFWLSCLSPLRITAEVDEEDIALVRTGQKVLIRADAFPGRIFAGHVQAVTPKGDPIARSYRVRITLDGASPLRIGMTTETNIVTSEKPHSLLVPTTAVSGNRVWTVRDGRLVQRAVATGVSGRDRTEIVRGIQPSDLVVVAPDTTLREGDRATITEVAQ
jgi:multidrug efflux system membrane fusion protein